MWDGRQSSPPTRAEAEAVARGNDPEDLCRVVLLVVAGEGDWVEGFCALLTGHGHSHVRGNALFALRRLASRGIPLKREVIQPIIERALTDPEPYVSGHALTTAEAVEWR